MRAMNTDMGLLHFVGIGGIGMSGIAEILVSLGYHVQGSDRAQNANVQRLKAQGVHVAIGHDARNIENAVAIVISSAVKDDNPEVIAARDAGIPVVRRAEMLAELMRLQMAVAVGGTHGKTTTTSMIGHMLEVGDFDPTVINGGIVNAYGSNTRLGQSGYMVVEADESDGTFTRLPAGVAVVTNMDAEHMEHYGSFDKVREAYQSFIANVPFYGYAILCTDHPEVQALIPNLKNRRIVTYGFNPQADVRATNIQGGAQGSTFDVKFARTGLELKGVYLSMPGRHNVQNALAALALAQEMEIPAALMKKALSSFTGVKRRFTLVGQVSGVTIVDDYAHHPTEIETVLKTARCAVNETGGKVIAVMQPHRYSRLRDLFEEFCTCFNDADQVIITDIYEAGESPIEGFDKTALVEGIRDHGHRNVQAVGADKTLAQEIAAITQSGDYVICMGAGDITAIAHELPKELEKCLNQAA